jgi:fucose permease
MDLRWRALAVLTMARTAMGFQFQSVPSVSTGLMHDLALDYADLGLLVGLYFLPGVFVSIPAGLAGPRYGDKRVVLAGLVLMVGGGLLTASAPSAHLVRTAGLDAAHAATVVGASTWAVVLSVQIGGIVAHRWNRSAALMAIGCLGWAFCALAAAIFPAAAAPALVVAGLVLGLPIGLILALPGQILAPSQRALGMGIFYLWLYLGHGTLPPLAGWVQDRLAATSASLVIVGVLALAILGLYGLFCALSPARSKPAAPLPSS